MNVDGMNSDPHERARLMIASSDMEQTAHGGLLGAEEVWLSAHLETCAKCCEFAANSREAVRTLRAIPITAGSRLVSATQMRVRERATELQRQQERFWIVCACCAAVTLCSTVTTALSWRGFAWLSQQWTNQPAWFSPRVWEGSFLAFYLIPAVVVGILLLACGTFLADQNTSYQDWP